MNLGEKYLALVIKIIQKPGQMTITRIEHDMAVMQPLAPQAQQQIPGDLALGPKRQGFRYARCPAAFRALKPVLGHEQLSIDQGAGSISHQGREDADLAVLGLAQTAVPLVCHADGLLAFLGKGGFIKNQRRAAAELGIGIKDQLLPNLLTRPVRFAQHVMKALVAAARHLLSHFPHVAPVTLKQALGVAPGGVFDRAGPALTARQIGAEVVFKVGKC